MEGSAGLFPWRAGVNIFLVFRYKVKTYIFFRFGSSGLTRLIFKLDLPGSCLSEGDSRYVLCKHDDSRKVWTNSSSS